MRNSFLVHRLGTGMARFMSTSSEVPVPHMRRALTSAVPVAKIASPTPSWHSPMVTSDQRAQSITSHLKNTGPHASTKTSRHGRRYKLEACPTKVARFSYLSALVCKDTSPTTAQAMITMHCGLNRSIDFHIFQHVAACCLFLLFLCLCCCCSRNHSVPAARGLYKAEPSAQQLCELHQLAPNGRLGPVLAARCAYSCNCGSLSGRFSAGDLHARIERGKS